MNGPLMSVMILAATALPTFAQDFGFSDRIAKPQDQAGTTGVMTGQAQTDTMKVILGGDMNFIWCNRDAALNQVRGSLLGDATPSSESVIHGHTQIFLNFTVDNVKLNINIETKRMSGGTNVDVLANDSGAQPFTLRNTSLTINEIFDPAVTLTVGSPRWVAGDFAGNGTSNFFDPGHSGSISNNTSGWDDVVNLPFDLAASRDELLPAGIFVSYGRTALHFDVAFVQIIQNPNGFSSVSVHSPSETAYLAQVMYDLPGDAMKGSRVGGLICMVDMPNDTAKMITFGGGAGLMGLTPGLEIVADVFLNTGTVSTAGGTDIKAKGMAFDAGAVFHIVNDSEPWIGAKIVTLSGDDDPLDSDSSNFLGYRTPGETAIIENDFFGLGVDTNLTKIQVSGGAKLSVGGGKGNLELSALIASMNATKKMATPTGTDKAYGTEVDLKVIYAVGKQVHLTILLAGLFGSDIVQDAGGGSANPLADDGSILLSFGADVQM